MIKVKWENNQIPADIKLPSGWVFFCFKKEDLALWCGFTPNISQRLHNISRKAEQDESFRTASLAAEYIEIEPYSRSVDVLFHYKVFVQEYNPPFQDVTAPWKEYVYLALDAYHFPFVSIQSDTNGDWTYAGPWRSRFFLMDIMDSISRILKLPFCETSYYPCDKLDKGICRGYCEALDEEGEVEDVEELNKLESLLWEAYLHPDNSILEMLTKEKEKYFNELEFEKEDLIASEVENFAKYRDWLKFLYLTKTLSYQTEDFGVENGLLNWCKFKDKIYKFPVEPINYRPNERLAINLNKTDEARLLYEYYIQNYKG
ncbi:hypothetical protein [Candidatus Syntrophosphaera thermopropionivorans]|jgi:excinuclease UvrABC nuclease subunit|uniref:Uncharacterized protein n=1 Tax=Candidatus Syntrophosphaera thermopropionivorans TaxID=2593015 RepID=A0AC61QK80_9BACT|nr:hypothetical protein [Candidatus Syntrophosphaera thermopropionivorans]TDF73832.1 hypothetical protein E0946_02110 [Candidatus Syntrophosphaera thermopropionivorans]